MPRTFESLEDVFGIKILGYIGVTGLNGLLLLYVPNWFYGPKYWHWFVFRWLIAIVGTQYCNVFPGYVAWEFVGCSVFVVCIWFCWDAGVLKYCTLCCCGCCDWSLYDTWELVPKLFFFWIRCVVLGGWYMNRTFHIIIVCILLWDMRWHRIRGRRTTHLLLLRHTTLISQYSIATIRGQCMR